MLTFLLSLFLFGKADINDNYHVYLGRDPRNQKPSPVIAIEYTTNYAQSRENQTMLFEMHPAYVYNAVQIMSDHDTFTINGVQYTKENEGLLPDWQPRLLAATAEMVVFEISQPNRINDNC